MTAIPTPVAGVEVQDADGNTYAFDVHPDIANSRAAGHHIAFLIAIGAIPPHPARVTLYPHPIVNRDTHLCCGVSLADHCQC